MKDFTMDSCTKSIGQGSKEGKWYCKWESKIISILFMLVFFILPFNDVYSQKNTAENKQGVAPVITPTNGSDIYGFEIDGNAKALNWPSANNGQGYGDWFSDPPPVPEGLGLFLSSLKAADFKGTDDEPDQVYDDDYKPLSYFLRDDITNNDPTVFDGRNKINDDPNTYEWKMGSAPTKNEIQTVAVHFTYGADTHPEWPEADGGTFTDENDLWIIMAGDREDISGSSYIDFELLQKSLTQNNDGSFTSLGEAGGRTIGDLLITLEFTIGGAAAKVVVREWVFEDGEYFYKEANLNTPKKQNGYFASVNTVKTQVPWSVYNTSPISLVPELYEYEINQWVEGAVNLSAFFEPEDPCSYISTLFIRTRTSGSSSQSQLKDFPGRPIQLPLDNYPEIEIASTDLSCNSQDDGFISITSAEKYDRLELWKLNGDYIDGEEPEGIDPENDDVKLEEQINEDDFEGLEPGSYYVKAINIITVTINNELQDIECAVNSAPETINEPDALNLEILGTDISCYGSADGYLSLDPEADPDNSDFDQYDLYLVKGEDGQDSLEDILAGTGNDEPTSDISLSEGVFGPSLGEGEYYILGTKASETQDGVDCYALSNAVMINEPDALNLEILGTDISCYGSTDGYLSLDPEADPDNSDFDQYDLYLVKGEDGQDSLEDILAGTGNDEPTSDISLSEGVFGPSLGEGEYYILGTKASETQDGVDCYALSNAVMINEPDALNLEILGTNVTCYGLADGFLSLDPEADPENSDFDQYDLYLIKGEGQDSLEEILAGTGDDEVTEDISLTDGVFGPSLGEGDYYILGTKESLSQDEVDCYALSNAVNIEEPDEVKVSGVGYDPTCEDLSGGYITVIASGYDRLELLKDGADTGLRDTDMVSDQFVGLSAGSYVIKAFADGGNGEEDECTAETDPIVLTDPDCDQEACTLGYWKNHTDRWCREGDDQDPNNPFIYETCDLYSKVFDIDFSAYGYGVYEGLTLLQALNQEGGGVNNLLRQSVAALLNICADEISYPYSGNLIAAVQEAFEDGTEGALAELASELDMINNMYPCPMDGSSATTADTCSNGAIAPAAAASSSEAVEKGDIILSPNPFRDVLTISYDFDYTSDVIIQVFSGQTLLRTFTDSNVTSGSSTEIDLGAYPSQMFVIRVITSKEIISKQASK